MRQSSGLLLGFYSKLLITASRHNFIWYPLSYEWPCSFLVPFAPLMPSPFSPQALGRTHELQFTGSGYELLSRVALPCGASFEAVFGRADEIEPVSKGIVNAIQGNVPRGCSDGSSFLTKHPTCFLKVIPLPASSASKQISPPILGMAVQSILWMMVSERSSPSFP